MENKANKRLQLMNNKNRQNTIRESQQQYTSFQGHGYQGDYPTNHGK